MNDHTRLYERRLRDALPCPFCNSHALEFGHMQNYVHCCSCGADGPEVLFPRMRDIDMTWRAALERWNARQQRAV